MGTCSANSNKPNKIHLTKVDWSKTSLKLFSFTDERSNYKFRHFVLTHSKTLLLNQINDILFHNDFKST